MNYVFVLSHSYKGFTKYFFSNLCSGKQPLQATHHSAARVREWYSTGFNRTNTFVYKLYYSPDIKRHLHNLNLGFIQLKHNMHFDSTDHDQGRIKGGATGAIAPGPPLQGGPP